MIELDTSIEVQSRSQSQLFANELIVFDGFKDRALKSAIESQGGIVSILSASFNISATILIYADNSNFKDSLNYHTAKNFGTKCISKSKFETKYKIVDLLTKFTDDFIPEEIADPTEPEFDLPDTKKLCRLLHKHLPDLHDNIHVPYDWFKDGGWNVINILYDNPDSLFYNDICLTPTDKERFNEIFDKYICIVEPIWKLDSDLRKYLENCKSDIYLKKIMTIDKYKIISPVYLLDIYKKKWNICKGDHELVDQKYKKHLDKIMASYKTEIKKFKSEISKIVTAYVYEYPIFSNEEINLGYVKGFINSIILTILDLAEKLISLNIYAIHAIIYDIVNYYIPLDEINMYNESDNDGKN